MKAIIFAFQKIYKNFKQNDPATKSDAWATLVYKTGGENSKFIFLENGYEVMTLNYKNYKSKQTKKTLPGTPLVRKTPFL